MFVHNDQAFSTRDRDNDNVNNVKCAEINRGGWWYDACHYSNLNGLYLKKEPSEENKGIGIEWTTFKGRSEILQWTEIKIRPKDSRASFS